MNSAPHAAGEQGRARITAVLLGRAADLEVLEAADEDDIARLGMSGSPTVLVDGVDVMDTPTVPRLACRLDLPTQQHLAAVLDGPRPANPPNKNLEDEHGPCTGRHSPGREGT